MLAWGMGRWAVSQNRIMILDNGVGNMLRIGQLHDDVILLQLLRILEFVVFLCKLRLLFLNPQRD